MDLTFIFNSLNGLNSYSIETVAVFNDDVYLRDGNVNKLVSLLPIPRTKLYINFFSNRLVHLWNKLPVEIRLSELNEVGKNTTFKNDLNKHYFTRLENVFNPDSVCTWSSICRCVNCRS